MFYIKEIIYRVSYLFYSFLFVFLYFYSIKEYFFTLIVSSISHKKNFYLQNFEISFILNSPNQLINLDFIFCLLITFIFIWPLLLLQIFYFFRSVLKRKQIYLYQKYYPLLVSVFFLWNYILVFSLFPYFWSVTEFFNLLFMLQSSINVEYEPNLLLYLNALWTCFKIINFFFIFYLFIFATICFFPIGLNQFFKNKKILNFLFLFITSIYLGFFFEIQVFLSYLYCIIPIFTFYLIKKTLYINSLFFYIKKISNKL